MPLDAFARLPIAPGDFLDTQTADWHWGSPGLVVILDLARPRGKLSRLMVQHIEQWFFRRKVPVRHVKAREVYLWATDQGRPTSRRLRSVSRFMLSTAVKPVRSRPQADAILAATFMAREGPRAPWRDPRRWIVGTRRVYGKPGRLGEPLPVPARFEPVWSEESACLL